MAHVSISIRLAGRAAAINCWHRSNGMEGQGISENDMSAELPIGQPGPSIGDPEIYDDIEPLEN